MVVQVWLVDATSQSWAGNRTESFEPCDSTLPGLANSFWTFQVPHIYHALAREEGCRPAITNLLGPLPSPPLLSMLTVVVRTVVMVVVVTGFSWVRACCCGARRW